MPGNSALISALSDPLHDWASSHPLALFPALPPWQVSAPSQQTVDPHGTLPLEPLHSLGPAADDAYTLGPSAISELDKILHRFVAAAFPPAVAAEYARRYGSLSEDAAAKEGRGSWDENKAIWQVDKDSSKVDSREVGSWKANGDGWQWELVDDAYVFSGLELGRGGKGVVSSGVKANDSGKRSNGFRRLSLTQFCKRYGISSRAASWYVSHQPFIPYTAVSRRSDLANSHCASAYSPGQLADIQRSDYLRYLLLAALGGIYSDTDTTLLKPPSRWTSDADLFNGGRGWLSDDQLAGLVRAENMSEGEEKDAAVKEVLGEVRAVVGVEADVGDREDWADWWPRPVSPPIRGWEHADVIEEILAIDQAASQA